MKILITGPRGFVGNRLMKQYKDAIPAPSLRGMTEDQVLRLVEESQADAIIHTAAVSDIPTCANNPEESYHANVLLPVYLARAANAVTKATPDKKIKLVCFSSDQVYSGLEEEGPYKEDLIKPGNLYASQKIEMEERVLDLDPDAVMLRAEWMYDHLATRGNYILNMLIAIQNQQPVAFSKTQYRGITYLREVAESMDAVLKLPGGAYNYGSETTRNMYEVTEEFCKMMGVSMTINEGPKKHNLWMDCSKAKKGGVIFSDVVEGLRKCIEDYNLKIQ